MRSSTSTASFVNTSLESLQELLDLCDFIEALCQALAELVSYQVIVKKCSKGQAKNIGKITECLKDKKVVVAKVIETNLSVGGFIWLVSENSSYCKLARIDSIQLDYISKNELEVTSEIEVGLMFNTETRKGLRLYVIL